MLWRNSLDFTRFMTQVIFWYKSLLWRNDFDVYLFHDTGRFLVQVDVVT